MDKKIIACDLDGTLAHYDGWKGINHIGEVVQSVKQAIKNAQSQGHDVWIFTARVSDPCESNEATTIIASWLVENGINCQGITATKHKFFTEFWDDRALQVIKNEGMFVIEADNHWKAAAQLVTNAIEPAFTPVEDEKSSSLDIQEGGDHYKKYPIQPVEFVFKNKIPALEASALKYIIRHSDKNGMNDLRKAKHFIELIAELHYGEKL